MVALVALTLVIVAPNPTACGKGLWERPLLPGNLPSGWELQDRRPDSTGWSATLKEAESEASFAGSVYINVSCTADAGREFSVARDWSRDGDRTQIGVKSFGDESFGTRSESGGYEIYWRRGNVIGRTTTYGSEIEIGDLELVTERVVATLN